VLAQVPDLMQALGEPTEHLLTGDSKKAFLELTEDSKKAPSNQEEDPTRAPSELPEHPQRALRSHPTESHPTESSAARPLSRRAGWSAVLNSAAPTVPAWLGHHLDPLAMRHVLRRPAACETGKLAKA
jgi:hypothetical protein